MKEIALALSTLKTGNIPTGGLGKLATVLQTAVALAFFLAVIFCLIVLLWSGWNWMSSGGDKQKLQQARQRLVYAIIGLAVVFLSLLIMQVLGKFFGIDILQFPGT